MSISFSIAAKYLQYYCGVISFNILNGLLHMVRTLVGHHRSALYYRIDFECKKIDSAPMNFGKYAKIFRKA